MKIEELVVSAPFLLVERRDGLCNKLLHFQDAKWVSRSRETRLAGLGVNVWAVYSIN